MRILDILGIPVTVMHMGFFGNLFTRRPTPPLSARTLGRNEKCWCGSGAKYKACHLEKDQPYFARLAAAEAAACRGST